MFITNKIEKMSKELSHYSQFPIDMFLVKVEYKEQGRRKMFS